MTTVLRKAKAHEAPAVVEEQADPWLERLWEDFRNPLKVVYIIVVLFLFIAFAVGFVTGG